MARTAEQIQAQIDAIDKRIGAGVTGVTDSDGKSVTIDDIEGLERRRQLLVGQLAAVSGRRRGVRVSYVGLK